MDDHAWRIFAHDDPVAAGSDYLAVSVDIHLDTGDHWFSVGIPCATGFLHHTARETGMDRQCDVGHRGLTLSVDCPGNWIDAARRRHFGHGHFFSALYIRIFSNLQSKLEEQALTDALTGLSNRVLLQESLEQAIIRRARTKEPMTLIAIDLDHFKAVNDNYGHESGDNVLRGISDFFRTRVRTSDKAFRLGGEEFLILLNNADAATGMRLAEELRHGIETLPLLPDRNVTASLGVATLNEEDSTSTWMDRADRNLYKGKESGRNVVIGEDSIAP